MLSSGAAVMISGSWRSAMDDGVVLVGAGTMRLSNNVHPLVVFLSDRFRGASGVESIRCVDDTEIGVVVRYSLGMCFEGTSLLRCDVPDETVVLVALVLPKLPSLSCVSRTAFTEENSWAVQLSMFF